MNNIFQHHPDDRIGIISGQQRYLDTLANFRQDYQAAYPGLPAGIKAFRLKGKHAYYITEGDAQVPSDMDPIVIQQVFDSLPDILARQQVRQQTEADREENDTDFDRRRNAQTALKQLAERANIDTSTTVWREELLLTLAQRVLTVG